jgi:hypothetical protein
MLNSPHQFRISIQLLHQLLFQLAYLLNMLHLSLAALELLLLELLPQLFNCAHSSSSSGGTSGFSRIETLIDKAGRRG